MIHSIRKDEYKVLFYRLLLAYVFFFVARCFFFFYNSDLIKIDSVTDFFVLYYHGLAFDTTAVLYLNGLFLLFSIVPFVINTKKGYQKFLFYLYFIPNLLGFATNFIDFIYYRFNFGRSTIAALDSLKNESNKGILFYNFLVNYWHVFVLFFALSFLWIYLYKRVKIRYEKPVKLSGYFLTSIFGILIIATLAIGGIRGDFQKSTRPINLLDASRYVKNPSQADFVLNTPFTIIRTMFSNNFEKLTLVDQKTIDSLI